MLDVGVHSTTLLKLLVELSPKYAPQRGESTLIEIRPRSLIRGVFLSRG
jgi:hypothetical protein